MAQPLSSIFGCLAASLWSGGATGCWDTSSTENVTHHVGLTTAALSVCNETVPADRNVDGIPAYAQCAAAENSAIYSNNGVDTSTKKMGSDWYETQYDNGYQCTEFVVRYMYFKWKVKWLPDEDAGFWCDTQPPADSGIVQSMTPVHGDIIVFAPSSCGSDDEGHVGLVDRVNGSKLVVVEQNDARRGDVMRSCGKCFLHAVANDGSGVPASAGAAGAPGAAGAAAPAQQPQMAAAGAAAPSGGPTVSAAGSGAVTQPPATAPMTPAAAGSSSAPKPPVSTSAAAGSSAPKPPVSTSAAAGSSAVAPFAGAVSTAPRATNAAESGCSVAAVGSERRLSMPMTLSLTLLGGVLLRSRRRQHD